MLELTIVKSETYDEDTNEFSPADTVRLQLEHSLFALSKWESKHEKRFLDNKELTTEEVFDYFECMIVTPDFPPGVFSYASEQNVHDIETYIASTQSGTTFPTERPGALKGKDEPISSELMYYFMVKCNIPWEAQYWHINRLFTLIKIFTVKDNPDAHKNSRPTEKQLIDRKAENARRRAELQSKG